MSTSINRHPESSADDVTLYRKEMRNTHPHFAKLLFGNNDDSNVSEADLKDFSNNINLLQGSHELDWKNKSFRQACELLYMCLKFEGSQRLACDLRSYLHNNMVLNEVVVPDNVWTVIVFTSNNYYCQNLWLHEKAWQIIVANTRDVLSCDAFLSIPGSDLMILLRKPYLKCSEPTLYHACMRWHGHNKDETVNFIQHIRFLQCPEMHRHALNCRLLSLEQKSRILAGKPVEGFCNIRAARNIFQ